MTVTYLITACAVLIYMTAWFVVAQIRGRNDIADVAWGLGFVLVALVSLCAGGLYPQRGVLVSSLVLAWGIRLAYHIHSRYRGKGEDRRYRAWREEWGRWFVLRSFLQVFMLQGALLLMVAVPVIHAKAVAGGPLGWLDGLDRHLLGLFPVRSYHLFCHIADKVVLNTLFATPVFRAGAEYIDRRSASVDQLCPLRVTAVYS